MLLPRNFAREFVKGHHAGGRAAANGWRVRVWDKAVFVPRSTVQRPGAVRKLLEHILKLKPKPTAEDRLVFKSRLRAQGQRNVKNRIAAGHDMRPPWSRCADRSLRTIKAEERLLNIVTRWQRMGEYRR
jgi:hypothetical protein